MSMRPCRRALAPGLLATLLATAGAAPAPARPHTVLLATYPAADTVHASQIREVRLRFSTPVQPSLSTVTVLGPAGVVREVGDLEPVPGSDLSELRLPLAAALGDGAYTVEWRTAGPDNHPITGRFGFSVALPPRAEAEPAGGFPGDVPGVPELAQVPATRAGSGPGTGVAVRALFFLSILGMVGTALFRLAVVGPMARDPLLQETALDAARRARTVAGAVLALALAAVPARLWSQASELFGEGALATANLARLLASGWGGAWLLQLAMAGLFGWGLFRTRADGDRTRGWWAMLAGGLGMALVPALSGHAAGTPAQVRAFAVLNDALHVTAAGAWLGTLAVLLLAGLAAATGRGSVVPAPAGGAWAGEDGLADDAVADGDEEAGSGGAPLAASALPPLARMVNAFSRVALASVAVLFATGVVNAWWHLGSVGALVTSAYGRTLLLKLCVVVAAALLGFYNWRMVRPLLAREPRAGLIRIPASIEALLGVGVVLVTALLVATQPPAP